MKNPAAGGGRWVEVPPERFVSWIVTFAERHGGADGVAVAWPVMPAPNGGTVTFSAADGAAAQCHPPFPSPVSLSGLLPPLDGPIPPDWAPGHDDGERAVAEALAADAAADRTVGVLLVRLGGFAVGVFSGAPPRLVSSKTGSRPVHGRSAAGGWSQQRFARRRENQAATALRAAADAAAEVFGPYGPAGLDAVVLGGDKRSAAGLRDDVRLAGYLALAVGRFLTVPDPRLAVLRDTPRAFRAIRIRLTEPHTVGPVPG
jgi:Actinobacteria/chloroflexi VLRF1 release factor